MDTLLLSAIDKIARPWRAEASDLDPLIEWIGDKEFVLLGEASHGTHEFYRIRAEITRRLITESGFTTVAVEADWPDAYRINRFVHGRGSDVTALEALGDFKRFPTWMWRNTDVLDFVAWLRHHNDALAEERKASFYGMDLYSMYTSMQAVLGYLEKVDPDAARRARQRYSCLEHFGEDSQAYGYAATYGLTKACEDEVVAQLVEMLRRATDLASRDGKVDPDEFFFAQQNARLVASAEHYYRTVFTGGHEESWNLRDRHMAGTLGLLKARRPEMKIVVWAHNSHLGDARATEMSERGEVNVGQLVRETHGRSTYLVGLTTHSGTVTAASDWDAPADRKTVRPALQGSFEALFHESGIDDFLLPLHQDLALENGLRERKLERAIGVIYRPETERVSHYFAARLSDQFDAIIHLDRTRALIPLERTAQWESVEPPETYPFAV
jgi:erythromycin esterase-like protein